MNDLLDKYGYPTEEALQAIRDAKTPAEAVHAAAEAWNQNMGSVSYNLSQQELYVIGAEPEAQYLRFATGGWSGNEDVIIALEQNIYGILSWELSAAGGLHIYEVKAFVVD